jgi:Domain of unknown function (DUF4911)
MSSNERCGFRSLTLAIVPGEIARFKAIVESYDNLATLRTEDPRNHYLRLYFDVESTDEVEALLDALGQSFSVRRIHEH